ncbi:hypothetical protein BRADI_3g34273v3 [Brachypodium distachyon]|uniref:Uncharacterized protein n=1 Tax=Brachypodium distachyon TaxID=15368 RepID=A0A0Q3FEC3_BRADI|nr:hypothetical protein BRADI_3g34273v3 [Brachypodium distachyon]
MAAADDGCTFYRCFCSWQHGCASRIPRVYPGRDYVHMPAGADVDDDRPMWSLLVGLTSVSQDTISHDSLLGLHRFRVARSGRILGRSDDALDAIYNHHTTGGFISIVDAALMPPDGHRSLCVFSEHVDDPGPGKVQATPRAQQLLAHLRGGRRALPAARPPAGASHGATPCWPPATSGPRTSSSTAGVAISAGSGCFGSARTPAAAGGSKSATTYSPFISSWR